MLKIGILSFSQTDVTGKRIFARILDIAALVAVATLVAVNPATAHNVVSDTRVSIGSAARTIYGPAIDFNLSQLGIGCTSSYRAIFRPTWRISNVTYSSVYIDYLTFTFTPYRSSRLGFANLIDGNNRELWRGNWLEPNITSSVTKTFYFRRTVSFGTKGYIDTRQVFGFALGSSVPGQCGRDAEVYFWLRRS